MDEKLGKQENNEDNLDVGLDLGKVFKKIIKVFGNDALMITIIIIAVIICIYCAMYSKGYDIKIQQYYHDYIEQNCKDMNNNLKFSRPDFLSVPSFKMEVKNETQS